ncbi:MAG TPA: PIN domain-containing protein [Terracidiphilus sp.]|jgi:predicted nucleic acid-binding protein|nr:PIN domain-containing protein [Terracidiphilus sp.]
MTLPTAFWDSSALIPLCVEQKQTQRSTDLFGIYGVAVWWAAPVEIVSGLTRLARMGEIGRNELLAGKQLAQTLSLTWVSINPSAMIAAAACSLPESHPLSAADALQLAAALEWCEGQPSGKVFLTFDRRLREAATLAGFTLE